MQNHDYTEKELSDAKEIIEIYNRTPEDKRPILTAAFNAFLAGMETQAPAPPTESETAHLEHCLLGQASVSLARMTTSYCKYVEQYMSTNPASAEHLATVQEGIRTLNHISVTLERLRRALQETAPAGTTD